jgi:hypothetical protein
VTHGVIGNTSDFGSAESWFEPRWVNKKCRIRGVFCWEWERVFEKNSGTNLL